MKEWFVFDADSRCSLDILADVPSDSDSEGHQLDLELCDDLSMTSAYLSLNPHTGLVAAVSLWLSSDNMHVT